MMLASPWLRVVPVTVHLSLRNALDALTTGGILHAARITARALAREFRIASPRLAIAGLNPHAGEEGRMGEEEGTIIRPAIASLRAALPPGWRVEAVDIDASASIAESIDRVFGRDIDFFWTSPERSIYDQATIRQLLLTSLRRRVPVFGFSEAFVRAGALVGVSIEPADQGEQAAEIAITRLRRGAEAGAQRVDAAPVHRTAKARVALNRVVAEKLGIKLPNRVVSDADTVFGDS